MKSKIKSATFAFVALSIAIGLITFPKYTLEASMRGIDMWWGTVFPSLLPFFVTAELLIGFGVVRFIGVIFEPIMRPLFNVPGAGSFVWAMGMASGYPSGAKLTARLRQEKQLTKIEAERLVSFTNASNPLFIIAAVSVGFFHDTSLGFLLAIVHYSSNALVGICMRFYGRGNDTRHEQRSKLSIKKAFDELHGTRLRDKRPFGKIFGDAIVNSVQTLLMIGGFIIIFSVITTLLLQVGIAPFLSNGLAKILELFHLPSELSLPIFSGLFEITLGAQLIADTNISSILSQAIAVSFIFAFNGFSVQAQVASILAETDIRFLPYFFARILHGILASGIALLLFPYVYEPSKTTNQVTSVFLPFSPEESFNFWITLSNYGPIITLIFLGIATIILITRFNKHL
ncbi:Sporulation integral membrane protein YlbJ [Paraliobacillus sp. PM-2]|uniref:sporulation integral membrane protein YlbJ n=1 Tax=Paraliobacillus sp. PM-2 TaxID=1462524 RepID=UPI00061C6D89|nr:sporulation integral membrane protein YlbJ [Paraliobacillus sp. PM-2]CQR47808.1 Sporulation integral membrane protein YlbJ [Paraliobacillus sp. PM-2]